MNQGSEEELGFIEDPFSDPNNLIEIQVDGHMVLKKN